MRIEIKIKNKTVSVLLKKGEGVLDELKILEEHSLSEKLLPVIGEMLKKHSLEPEDVEKMELESDLGENFTTYRIAKSVVEAWNFGNSLRIAN